MCVRGKRLTAVDRRVAGVGEVEHRPAENRPRGRTGRSYHGAALTTWRQGTPRWQGGLARGYHARSAASDIACMVQPDRADPNDADNEASPALNVAPILAVALGDCRKITYQIAQDFRSHSRSDGGSIAGLCDCRRDTEGGRKDQRHGMGFDRNRLNARVAPLAAGLRLVPGTHEHGQSP